MKSIHQGTAYVKRFFSSSQNPPEETQTQETVSNGQKYEIENLTKIPTPGDFQRRPWKNRQLTSSVRNEHGIYEGEYGKNKEMCGNGKLYTEDKKQYIDGTWKDNRLTNLRSCQFVINLQNPLTVYIRKRSDSYLFIIDEITYVARVHFDNALSFKLGTSFKDTPNVLFKIMKIDKVLEDTTTDELESACNKFREIMDVRKTCTASSEDFAEDIVQINKIFTKHKNSSFQKIFTEIKHCIYISEDIKEVTTEILEKEALLTARSKYLPIKNSTKCEQILHKLKSMYSEVVQNHKNALRRYCPSLDSELSCMAGDIDKINNTHILFIRSNDLCLFVNLSTMVEQFRHNLKQMLTEHVKNLWNQFRKLKNIQDKSSVKASGRLTNSVYLQLFSNFLELLKNMNEDYIKYLHFASDGTITIKNITEKNDEDLKNSYENVKFLCNILNYYKPGSYVNANQSYPYKFKILSPKENILKSPQEKLVWLYILDNAIAFNFKEEQYEDVKQFFAYLFNCYTEVIHSSKSERYESFRVLTNDIIKFISSVSPYLLSNQSYGCIDEDILRSQITIINNVIKSDNDRFISDIFSSLIHIYNDYWNYRDNIVGNLEYKFPHQPFQEQLQNMSKQLLQITKKLFNIEENVQLIVTCCRSLNEFFKLLNGVDFSWLVQKNQIRNATRFVLLKNKDKANYQVSMIEDYIKEIGMSNVSKHYVIEIINSILNIIIKFLSKENHMNRIEALSDLLLATGRSLIYFKDQHKYTDFEQFLADSTKPFLSVIESTNYSDFKRRINNIENFYLYTRRQGEINIDKALDLYSYEARQTPGDFDSKFDNNMLKSCYNKYIKEFERTIITTEDNIIDELRKELEGNESINIENLVLEFKQEVIPSILAKISALWAKMESKDVETKPHCIQILCILRLLSVDNDNAGIDHHLAQLLTGQGKSIVLGLLATLLGLLNYNVRVVCYSGYLARRDQQDFYKFYKKFNLQSKIKYGTFEDMANEVLIFNVNGESENLRSAVTKIVKNEFKNQVGNITTAQVSNTILLIDEVDVFFQNFYGDTYNPCALIVMPALGKIQVKIWELVSNGMRSKDEILQRIKKFTNNIVIENDDPAFSKLLHLSQYMVIEHLGKMIDDALIVVGGNWPYKDRFKIKDGNLCFIRDDGIYSTTSFFEYLNAFFYIKLKKDNLEVRDENYSYLFVDCGNISYAKLPNEYALILGVSGTLTTLNSSERQGVKSYKINKISSMPTFFGLHKLIFDKYTDFVIAKSEEEWHILIYTHINSKIQKNRSVIVFFVNETQMNKFKDKYEDNIDRLHYLTGNEDETNMEWYVSEAGISKTVTLATRNMGRGVDYKSNDSTVEENGGVHVIQTFFSTEEKEETQLKGRTARKDNKGSYELIVCKVHLDCNYDKKNTYNDFVAVRKQLEEKNRSDDNDKIKKSSAKHDKTIDFLKSLSTYTIDERENYLSKYPIVPDD